MDQGFNDDHRLLRKCHAQQRKRKRLAPSMKKEGASPEGISDSFDEVDDDGAERQPLMVIVNMNTEHMTAGSARMITDGRHLP